MLRESTVQIVRLSAGVLLIVGLMMMARWPIAEWPFAMGDLALTTVGAWLVGMAFHAWWIQRKSSESGAMPSAVQLAGFGVGLLTVLLIYSQRLKLNAGAMLFGAALVGATCCGVVVLAEIRRNRSMQLDQPRLPLLLRIGILGFVIIACYIGGKLLLARTSSYSENGIFPERLNEPAVRMFGMFYLSVALAAASCALSRGTAPLRAFAICGLVLLALILIAAGIHWPLWDFQSQPRAAIYPGVYGFIAICTAIALWLIRHGRSSQK